MNDFSIGLQASFGLRANLPKVTLDEPSQQEEELTASRISYSFGLGISLKLKDITVVPAYEFHFSETMLPAKNLLFKHHCFSLGIEHSLFNTGLKSGQGKFHYLKAGAKFALLSSTMFVDGQEETYLGFGWIAMIKTEVETKVNNRLINTAGAGLSYGQKYYFGESNYDGNYEHILGFFFSLGFAQPF